MEMYSCTYYEMLSITELSAEYIQQWQMAKIRVSTLDTDMG